MQCKEALCRMHCLKCEGVREKVDSNFVFWISLDTENQYGFSVIDFLEPLF